MPSRLDYLIQKLDDLEDAIRREKREYDRARDRYDRMRSRDILEDLREQLLGYQTEHDELQRARAARERAPPQQRHNGQPQGRPSHPPNNTQQRQQQHMPPPPPPQQHRTAYPHRGRPAPQQSPTGAYPPRNNYYGPGSSENQRPAPPRPRQKTEMLDYEIEEPDGKTYVVRGGAVFRDFDPARDAVRKPQ
ncbi:hypothetical protein KVR01_008222 [Diaporthe batatas]|uniref:uncharacterized protein n=1 Tax=Diaporthe batatas TaxID=748121 RepID=UPI001D039C90|nr:uncharacterized protein KVR01_008222 [Diaporthe batatas]KAG8162457.1 hypothetical protein KVR01_008222 [Diaporthe batatas]